MKKTALALTLFLLINACQKEYDKFELFSPVAFAYSLDNSWELNASCQVKGFARKEYAGRLGAQVSFVLDLKMPNGTIKKDIQHGRVNQLAEDDVRDLTINTQINLDSTYTAGKYVLIFNAKDDFSGSTAKIEKQFEL